MVSTRIRQLMQKWRTLALWACLGVLIAILGSTPAVAQTPRTAAIVVDGQKLFKINGSGNLTAEERADIVNSRLQQAIQSPEPIQVEVFQQNKLPTILLNDRHLLTVTEQDTLPGRIEQEQAVFWARQIETTVEQARQERTTAYLREAIGLSLFIVAIAGLLHWILGRSWQRTLRPAMQTWIPQDSRDATQAEEPGSFKLLLGLLLAIARTGVWLSAAFYVTNLFPITRHWIYRVTSILINSFTAPIVSIGKSQYSVIALLILAALLFGVVLVSRAITDVVKSRILQFTWVNRGAQEAVAIIIRYSIIFVGTLVLLQLWGLDISSLALLASALGIGVGLGLQNIAKDFGSGLILLFERPIQVGDFVQLQNFEGTVERIGARSTLIRTLDQVSIIVPNSRFLDDEVINWSHSNPISRLHLPVGVAYGSNVDLVRSALIEAAQDYPRVLSTPTPQVFFKGFGESALNFELLVWTAEPSQQLVLKSDLYFRIEAQFRRYKIEVPFPQHDLHVRTGTLPLELSPELEQVLRRLLEGNGTQIK